MAFRHETLILVLAATLALGFAGDSFARVGGGFSFGSAAHVLLARLRPHPRRRVAPRRWSGR
jgi:hypothetical protein